MTYAIIFVGSGVIMLAISMIVLSRFVTRAVKELDRERQRVDRIEKAIFTDYGKPVAALRGSTEPQIDVTVYNPDMSKATITKYRTYGSPVVETIVNTIGIGQAFRMLLEHLNYGYGMTTINGKTETYMVQIDTVEGDVERI